MGIDILLRLTVNLYGLIGNNAPKYTIKSLGVPGNMNNIIIIHSSLLLFLNIFLRLMLHGKMQGILWDIMRYYGI